MTNKDKLTVEGALLITAEGSVHVDPYPIPDWLRAYMEYHQPDLSETREGGVATFWRHVRLAPIVRFVKSAERRAHSLDYNAIRYIEDLRLHCSYWVAVFEAEIETKVRRARSEEQKERLPGDPTYQHLDAALSTLYEVCSVLPSDLVTGHYVHDIIAAIRSKSTKKRGVESPKVEDTRAPIDGSDACLIFHLLSKIILRPIPDPTLDDIAAILTGYSKHTAREARANLRSPVGLRVAKLLLEDVLRGIDDELRKNSPNPLKK